MKEHIDLQDDVVMVTGAAGGIGSAVAEEFTREGATTVLTDVDSDEGERLATTFADDHPGTAEFRQLDVSDYEACVETVEAIVADHGTLDVLINVAAGGIRDHETKPFIETTPDEWQIQLDVTFLGQVHTAHAALPHMYDQERGAIVNFISEAHKGQERGDDKLYAAAKGGLATFTKSLATEAGEHGVRVNGISPAATRTPATEDLIDKYGDRMVEQYALDRLGRPTDSAYASVFLASDAAAWITGQILSVNGGYS